MCDAPAGFAGRRQSLSGAVLRGLTVGALAALPIALAPAGVGGEAPPIPEIYAADASEPEADWSPALATLGRRLFQDRRLSKDHSLSCQDCHQPRLAFTDGRRVALGVAGQVGARNTPTLVNRALGQRQFWDGRSRSLEEQALGPMTNPKEMAMDVAEALQRVKSDSAYTSAFREACGGEPTAERMAAALAAYERTIYSVDAPFDRFVAGDTEALSPSAQRGLKLFGAKAHCGECHAGPNFTDELFHNIGVRGDPGRGDVTQQPQDVGAFKTPTLREVALTAPYMHDGSKATLLEVVEFYDQGGLPHATLDAKVRKLGLTLEERLDLVAFMESLSGRVIEGPPAAVKPEKEGR